MKKLIRTGLTMMLVLLSFSGISQEIERVRAKIDSSDIQHKDIVLAQAILETGWFTSYNYTFRNNCFGFYYKGLMKFDTVQDCVDYYQRWQERHYTGGDYYDFLECLWVREDGTCVRYAKDPDYVSKLKSIVKKIQ